ncbi:hypothetical protein COU74_01485 [Candidatus Peregrinibacteria bacterium CG10_big_fil_rev_8_21_14_0_10_36_19]|nr:MAG: hypothetical protein COU74_01485 [Candidatus Peregrinibacteria bacterium CG10_big_fil_rev_8_21_14_0_10_36_19]
MKKNFLLLITGILFLACSTMPAELENTPLGTDKETVLKLFPEARKVSEETVRGTRRDIVYSDLSDCYIANRTEEKKYKQFTLCFNNKQEFSTLLYKKASNSTFTRNVQRINLNY